MIKKALRIVAFFAILYCSQNCANQGSPSGGPKDTIPPVLIGSYPKTGQVNFKDQSMTLYFNEFVDVSTLKQNLIITPQNPNQKYKVYHKRNRVILKFSEPFEDSTTYSLNFYKGITDFNEKNPAENLIIAFSTGSKIDSLSVEGQIKELYTQEKQKGVTIGLYKNSDTLDFFKHKPKYFVTTNDSGEYKLQYIKSDNYRIVAFKDENKNLLLNADKEAHGFKSKIFNPKEIKGKMDMNIVLLNIKPFKLISARGIGKYYDIKYNKQIKSYKLNTDKFYHILRGEEKNTLRIYKPKDFELSDSLMTIIKSQDSIKNKLTDTLYVKFTKTKRKPKKIKFNLSSNQSLLTDTIKFKANFTKPIYKTFTDSIILKKDSTFEFQPKFDTSWNYSRTELTLTPKLNAKQIKEQLVKLDTTERDSEEEVNYGLQMIFKKGTFVSIENDTTKQDLLDLYTKNNEEFGKIKINVQSKKSIYAIQLLDGDKVKYQKLNTKTANFNKVRATTYSIRLLIDSDSDGKWTYGNLLENIEPEEVYIHKAKTAIRANWEIEVDIKVE